LLLSSEDLSTGLYPSQMNTVHTTSSSFLRYTLYSDILGHTLRFSKWFHSLSFLHQIFVWFSFPRSTWLAYHILLDALFQPLS